MSDSAAKNDAPLGSSQASALVVGESAAEAMTPEQLAEARQYGRLELICSLTDKVLDVAFLMVMALLLARLLTAWLDGFELPHRGDTLRLAAPFLVATATHLLV